MWSVILHEIRLLSYRTHNLVFKDKKQSWCSRAYSRQDQRILYSLMVQAFPEHCRDSYLKYHVTTPDQGTLYDVNYSSGGCAPTAVLRKPTHDDP